MPRRRLAPERPVEPLGRAEADERSPQGGERHGDDPEHDGDGERRHEAEPAVEVEPVQEAPALALVEDAPAEEPVLVSSNGHNPQSLGFFA